MIYECDKCGAALPPHAKVCPKCGFVFQGTVPADADMPGPADPPKPGFTPRVPRPPPGLHLHGASSRWARMERPFAKVLVCLAALHLLVGAFGAYIAAAYDLPQGFRLRTRFSARRRKVFGYDDCVFRPADPDSHQPLDNCAFLSSTDPASPPVDPAGIRERTLLQHRLDTIDRRSAARQHGGFAVRIPWFGKDGTC